MPNSHGDQWAQWLLHRRHGGDPDELSRLLDWLIPVRDRVLENARIVGGETLLDVGTGDGLIAFDALQRTGEHGSVIFSDVSHDLLDHARTLAERSGVAGRCRFVVATAENLTPIEDASVDVVTTRSVLIYVAAKQQAFAEFARVLRRGGRISLYEPISRHGYPEPPGRFWGYDVSSLPDLVARLAEAIAQHQSPHSDPMLNFDERDLLTYAGRAGFAERHLELRVDTEPLPPREWETFVRTAFNPNMPTLEELLTEALTPAERTRFTARLRPLVEGGEGTFTLAGAYLWGTKG